MDLKKLKKIHAELGNLIESSESDDGYDWRRRLRVLCDVALNGGVVSYDEWGTIGKKHGYDRRGLGGFFNSDGKTMTKIANNKRALTDEGREQVELYLKNKHWSGAAPTEEDAEKYDDLIDEPIISFLEGGEKNER